VLVSAPEPRALIFYQFILCAIESGVSVGEQARAHSGQALGDLGGEAHVGEDVALEVDARGESNLAKIAAVLETVSDVMDCAYLAVMEQLSNMIGVDPGFAQQIP
jgi:hypothetical protein